MNTTTIREIWNGHPVELDVLGPSASENDVAQCVLFSHEAGWERRLDAAGQIVQAQVCRTQEEVRSTLEARRRIVALLRLRHGRG